jgi:6-phosphogluconolactonase
VTAEVRAPEVVVLPTTEGLAADVAGRLGTTLAHIQQRRTRAALALTAGSIMEKVWAELAKPPAADAVDWSRVDVFWGDERFVPHDSSDRNDLPAERLLFGAEPFSAARRYSMPASDGEYGDDLDAAAAGYARTLYDARRPDDHDAVPNFDIVLLGVGPDGHCCSLFPEHPGVYDDSAPVIPVRNSPKPPPARLSLSFDGLNTANEIWVVVSGSGKADAAAMALQGAGRVQVPSAGARGRFRTLWLLDRDAAAKLPSSIYRLPVS